MTTIFICLHELNKKAILIVIYIDVSCNRMWARRIFSKRILQGFRTGYSYFAMLSRENSTFTRHP